MATLEAFQTGIQPTLLFIKQAVEQGDRRPQLFLFRIARLALRLPGGPLFLTSSPTGRGIEIERAPGLTGQAAPVDQLTEGILD